MRGHGDTSSLEQFSHYGEVEDLVERRFP
jgi:hypothetical protein